MQRVFYLVTYYAQLLKNLGTAALKYEIGLPQTTSQSLCILKNNNLRWNSLLQQIKCIQLHIVVQLLSAGLAGCESTLAKQLENINLFNNQFEKLKVIAGC